MASSSPNSPSNGYLRTPAIAGDTVAFVTEDDLWSVDVGGGVARRLTANLSEVSRPALSPDGEWVGFTSRDEHHPEVYAMPAAGGEAKRLTWLGANSMVRGWTPTGAILFATDAGRPFFGDFVLASVPPIGGPVETLPWGPATEAAWGSRGEVVLGRFTADPARWKRYRGGRAGKLWIDRSGDGSFRPLVAALDGNLAHPMWVGGRVWFVSDHEGIGNLYSCRPDGADLTRHTDHDRYYARFAASDGRRVVYAHAADLWLYDPSTGEARKIEIDLRSPRVQRHRKFASAADHQRAAALHPAGHSVAVTTRASAFVMGLWEGAVRQVGCEQGVRYRAAAFSGDGTAVVCVADTGTDVAIEVHPMPATAPDADQKEENKAGTAARPTRRRRPAGSSALAVQRGKVTITPEGVRRVGGLDLGCIEEVRPAPVGSLVALSTHRWELVVVDTETGLARVLDRSPHAWLGQLAWSPDGRWLAYSASLRSAKTASIRLCEVQTGVTADVTTPEFGDWAPAWDPEGKYLYFLSARVFDPVADSVHFEYSFPRAVRPYVVTLRADLSSPLIPPPRGISSREPREKPNGPDGGARNQTAPAKPPSVVEVDLAGIGDRIQPLPVPEGRYIQIGGLPGKLLFSSKPVEGTLRRDPLSSEPEAPNGSLEVFDFAELRHETLFGGLGAWFTVSQDRTTLLYESGRELRAIRAGEKPPEGKDNAEGANRKSGWIDLGRIRVSVDPGCEWRQMLLEAWRNMRNHFWVEDMSRVDWEAVRDRYLPLVDRVATRLEFSDLVWEMQGELGTSHAYELGGDYRPAPSYAIGSLGTDLRWDPASRRWRVARLLRGDPSDPETASPLRAPGVNVSVGDAILAVNGQPVSADAGPAALLVNQAGMLAELTVEPAGGGPTRALTVQTLRDERAARYRDWVAANREAVRAATGGRVGYLHIPDMGARGYAEFHRALGAEVDHDGLIVDVRHNGGGHVSPLLLEKLARRRIGFDVPRFGQPLPYPDYSPAGPLVALTDESAGSDGDIFTHGFKLFGLGPVIGKRTWGGVIGISPRHVLADGGFTTQPEYSFWFADVGWGIENHGTEPDIEVDIRPQDHAAGRDPQLERAIAVAMRLVRSAKPLRPDLRRRPRLTPPALPPRPAAASRRR